MIVVISDFVRIVQDVKKHNATDVVRVGGATYTTNLLQNAGIHVMVIIII